MNMNFQESKKAIRRQREIREEKANIRGVVNKLFKEILNLSENILDSLRNTEDGRKNEEVIKNLAQELNIEEKELQQSFKDGLRYNLKAAYRSGIISEYSSYEEIQDIITSYTLSFRSALKALVVDKNKKNKEVAPIQALEIAKRAYILSPKILREMRKKFPGVDEYIIKHAAIGYPQNPESFISEVLQKIQELKQQFPDVDDYIIKHAAVGYPSSPESFINQVLQKMQELKVKFPEVDEYIIKYTAVGYPSNPESFIKQVLQKIQELQQKFPDVDDYIIKRAVVNYPSNPESFINQVLQKIEELKQKFPDVDEGIIKRAAVYNPSDPENFIKNWINNKKD